MTEGELHQACTDLIAEIRAQMDAFDENGDMRAALQDDGKTTDLRAAKALLRPERFAGEHQVAQAWLYSSPTARIWGRNGK